MQIVPYQPTHLPGLYTIYRQATENLPHCRFMPSQTYTGQALARAEQAGEGLLVAEDHGAAQGIVMFRPVAPGRDGVPQLEITGLFSADEAIIPLLLAACFSKAQGAQRIVAFPAEDGHCPMPAYNSGWNGLSDQMPSVARVLARHGFAPTYRELHLECTASHFPPPPLPAPPGITLIESTGDRYLAVRALTGDQEAGVCLYLPMSNYSDHPEASGWGYIDWLHVAEAQRRRGLGRYLITWALRRLWEQGCLGCWLTTIADNWSAQALYLSLGFAILDTSSSWAKHIRTS